MKEAVFQNVDCVSFAVDDLDSGIAYYRDGMGLKLLWRTADSCGLGLENDIAKVVLVTRRLPTVQFKTEAVGEALERITAAGGEVTHGPFGIDIGLCAVVRDPFGNEYCVLDMSKGRYQTDGDGNVISVAK